MFHLVLVTLEYKFLHPEHSPLIEFILENRKVAIDLFDPGVIELEIVLGGNASQVLVFIRIHICDLLRQVFQFMGQRNVRHEPCRQLHNTFLCPEGRHQSLLSDELSALIVVLEIFFIIEIVELLALL